MSIKKSRLSSGKSIFCCPVAIWFDTEISFVKLESKSFLSSRISYLSIWKLPVASDLSD